MSIISDILRTASSYDTRYYHAGRWWVFGYQLRAINRVLDDLYEVCQMAGKSSRSSRNNFPETTFIQFKLSSDQKKAFRKWQEEQGTKVYDEIALFMSEGNKLSVSWDDQRNHWIVSSTCKDEDNDNVNCCITSRAEDWLEGVAMNVYKARVVMGKTAWRDFAADDDLG